MSKPLPDRVLVTRRLVGWFLLLGLLAAQVWGLYLLVPGSGEPLVPGQDKVAHALLFGVPFALALLLGARSVAVVVLAHALVSEPLQGLLTSTRTADLWDTVADLTGIAVAAVGVLLVRHRVARRHRGTPSHAPASDGVRVTS